jgi:hypothetical protein
MATEFSAIATTTWAGCCLGVTKVRELDLGIPDGTATSAASIRFLMLPVGSMLLPLELSNLKSFFDELCPIFDFFRLIQ